MKRLALNRFWRLAIVASLAWMGLASWHRANIEMDLQRSRQIGAMEYCVEQDRGDTDECFVHARHVFPTGLREVWLGPILESLADLTKAWLVAIPLLWGARWAWTGKIKSDEL